MKKLVIPFLFVFFCSFSMQTDSMFEECQQSKVWICSNSACYHKTSSCMEIKNCSKTQTTLATAQKQGKKACPVCYPQKSSSSQATKTQKSTTTNSSTTNQATKTKKSTTSSSTTNQATKTKKSTTTTSSTTNQATKTKKTK